MLVVSFAALVAAAAVGGGVFDRLSNGGFEDPDAESTRAVAVLEERFGTGPTNLVFLVTATDGDVDTVAAVEAGATLTEELAGRDDLADVVGDWSFGGIDPLRSDDGPRALIVARALGDDDQRQEVTEALLEEIPGVRRHRRRAAPGGGRRGRRVRGVPGPVAGHRVHRRVGVLDQPGHRDRPGAGDRLQPLRRVAVP